MSRSELELRVIKLYESGLSFNSIARKLDSKISSTTAYNIIKRNDIPTRTRGGIRELPIKEIVDYYYIQNLSVLEIAKKYNVHEKTIYNYLSRNGYEARGVGEYHNPELMHDYFENIDTERKAYFLGFMIADGNVMIRDNSAPAIRLSINSRDKYILDVFKREVLSENKISYSQKKDMSTFSIHSQKMFDDISKFGVVPNKTFKTYLPFISAEFMPHLIRGVFDGDGWITTRKTKTGSISSTVGFCGVFNFMEQIRDYLCGELGLYCVKVVTGDRIPTIQWSSSRDVKEIGRYLYQNSTTHLIRKFDKFNITE